MLGADFNLALGDYASLALGSHVALTLGADFSLALGGYSSLALGSYVALTLGADFNLAPGGYADSADQDAFCGRAGCAIVRIYDQSEQGNHLHLAGAGGEVHHGDRGCNATQARVAVGGGRAAYGAAFDAISRDPNNELVVLEEDGAILGMLQLTFLPNLSTP